MENTPDQMVDELLADLRERREKRKASTAMETYANTLPMDVPQKEAPVRYLHEADIFAIDVEDDAYSALGRSIADEVDRKVLQQIVDQPTALQAEAEAISSLIFEISVDGITTAANGVELSYSVSPSFAGDAIVNGSGTTYAFTPPSTNVVQLDDKNGDLIVRIENDGNVVLGDKVHPHFAAQEFWDRIADIGGNFYKRMDEVTDMNDQLRDDYNELDEEFESEQSQRLELQELITEIASAMGVPQAMEIDLPEIAEKMKLQLDYFHDESRKGGCDAIAPAPKDHADANALTAYERAMKVVR